MFSNFREHGGFDTVRCMKVHIDNQTFESQCVEKFHAYNQALLVHFRLQALQIIFKTVYCSI